MSVSIELNVRTFFLANKNVSLILKKFIYSQQLQENNPLCLSPVTKQFRKPKATVFHGFPYFRRKLHLTPF